MLQKKEKIFEKILKNVGKKIESQVLLKKIDISSGGAGEKTFVLIFKFRKKANLNRLLIQI